MPQGSRFAPFLWRLYVSDIGVNLPKGITHQIFADDLKLYTDCTTDDGSERLQTAVTVIAKWSKENSMRLSPEKCLVIQSRPSQISYHVSGIPLPTVVTARDLGVLMDARLLFREHISQTAVAANRVCNLILRAFVIRDVSVYLNLYRSLVIPRLTYCSTVWTPYLQRDVSILESTQKRFIRMVRARCGDSALLGSLCPVRELHRQADDRMFRRITCSPECDIFFDTVVNSRRSRLVYYPKFVAKTDRVNNTFAHRVTRRARGG